MHCRLPRGARAPRGAGPKAACIGKSSILRYGTRVNIAMIDVMLEPARPGASGLSDVVWHMARELSSAGDRVTIVGLYDSRAPLPPGDVRVHRLEPPARTRFTDGLGFTTLAASARAARMLRRIPAPEVVFAPDFVSGGIVAWLAPTLPVVCTTQGNIHERIATQSNPFGVMRTQVYKLATRMAVRRCAHIVAISAAMGDWWIRSGAPPGRISVIQRGTDVTFFRPEPAARDRLGIAAGIELVLFAGRFSLEKNVPVLLRAIAALAPRRPALRLHLCGVGPDEDALRELVRALRLESIVTFAGWATRERLRDYYGAADVFVLPSISEPLGRVVLEAMACETFVIATDRGGPADVITHEATGLLLPPHDADAWRAAIARALDDPPWRKERAAAGRAAVAARFSWPTIVRRLREDVFPRAIATRAARST